MSTVSSVLPSVSQVGVGDAQRHLPKPIEPGATTPAAVISAAQEFGISAVALNDLHEQVKVLKAAAVLAEDETRGIEVSKALEALEAGLSQVTRTAEVNEALKKIEFSTAEAARQVEARTDGYMRFLAGASGPTCTLSASQLQEAGAKIPLQWFPPLFGDLPADGEFTGKVRNPSPEWPRVAQALSSWVERLEVSQADFIVGKSVKCIARRCPLGHWSDLQHHLGMIPTR